MTMEPKEERRGESYWIDGLPEEEQYRYILSSVDEKDDWMHEREWRWADWHEYSSLEGLPL